MNNTLRTRLLSILFIFGLGIYALFPSIRYLLLSEDAKNNLSKDEIAYYESKSIKQGLDLKGGIYIVLEVDLPQLISSLAKNKDKNFDRFLDELSKEYTNNSADFFTVFEEKAEEQNLKLPRYFISYGKTKEQIIEQLDLQSTDSINRIIEIIQNRVDQFGVSEPTIQKQGNNRVVVELAGIQDSERARELLQSTALLELMIVKDVESTNTIVRQIDNLTSAANDTEEDNVDQLFNSDASANNDLGFSSLLIAVSGSDLAVSSNNLPALKNILSQESVQQVLDATGSLFLTGNSPETLINDFGEEEEVYLLYHLVDNAELTGGVIEDAQMRLSQSGVSAGQATVQVEMNNEGSREWSRTVSYTHLTLPTICSV